MKRSQLSLARQFENEKGNSMHLSQRIFKKPSLIVFVIVLLAAAVALLMVLDYFNLESFEHFNKGGFYFDYSWKGRMFLVLFLAVFVMEYAINRGLDQTKVTGSTRRRNLRIFAVLLCASIPLIYIASENFLGLNAVIVGAGDAFRGEFWRANYKDWANFLGGDWPLSLEYLVFAVSIAVAVFFAYGRRGLKAFSISLALVGGIGAVFLIDTLFPYGALEPLQMLTLPTSACATALLELMGFSVFMVYGPQQSGPIITIYPNNMPSSASVNWPCAGIHSLFLFVLVMALLMRKSDMSSFRKAIYFIFGFAVTYFVNVLRIVEYFVILSNSGQDAAAIYHRDYGELLFIAWMGIYIILIIFIEKFQLVEKIRRGAHSLQDSKALSRFKQPGKAGELKPD